ncbi:hypothetical protein GBAR_LOCUS30012 [Geodia barretti]|uniref:Uncharacterized protein n=1 Tax=Geodia barretti TaxID=519541 RepID=A0AA35XK94_GEOBA|nr:hypothetical protein GBAR_LOCUS30012 [Geodia barretti]
MGRAVETSAAVMALLLLPFASATFDYRNALDEDIATYILIGIAAVYFTATALLLLLAVCRCFVKAGKPKQKPLQNSNFERPSTTKKQLSTIHEDEEPFQSSRPQQKKASQRRVTRLRSDEEELITGEEGASLPPSPTETTATAAPPQPVRKVPDPRKKTSRSTGQATPPVRREPPRLPGAASPLEKTPETQRKETPRPNELPPLRNTPPPQRKQEPAAAYDFYSTKHAPIQRATNKRLDSPRMQQHKKLAISRPPDIALSSLPKRELNSPSNSSASEDLENFVSKLTVDEFKTPPTFKKTHLDTRVLGRKHSGIAGTEEKAGATLPLLVPDRDGGKDAEGEAPTPPQSVRTEPRGRAVEDVSAVAGFRARAHLGRSIGGPQGKRDGEPRG